MLDDLR